MMQCVLAGNAVANPVDLAQRLDIDVDEFTRASSLVADHLRSGFEQGQTVEPQPTQDQSDGVNRAFLSTFIRTSGEC